MPRDEVLTPDLLLQAYRIGVFPMSEGRSDPAIFWVDPRLRGILPLYNFHISKSLARRIRRGDYRVTVDTAFHEVMLGCADRPETWINGPILDLYADLFRRGDAHSVEVWQEDRLVGGTYGVSIEAAFFGESMFSRATDASKVALAYLVDRLRAGGYRLLDTQFLTPHLASLGGVEIPRADYQELLADALEVTADFNKQGPVPTGHSIVQRNIHTS